MMTIQIEIDNLPIGLTAFPDETLFSWCSRYHQLSGNGLHSTTSMQLFGDARAGLAHEFPTRLEVLAQRSTGAMGSAREIVHRMTVLPFYLPFKPGDLGEMAEGALVGDGIRHLKYRLGLLTSGLGANHPLKSCPRCVEEDCAVYGWTFWRRSHQLPGVWICPNHQVGLTVYPARLRQLFRTEWALPSPNAHASSQCIKSSVVDPAVLAWLTKLGQLSVELLSYAPGQFSDAPTLAKTLRRRLSSHGLAGTSGRIAWQKIAPRFEELIPILTKLPGLNHEANSALLKNQLQRALCGRAVSHPLRMLVWITTWFSDLEDFRQEYEILDDRTCIGNETGSSQLPDNTKITEHHGLLSEVREGTVSVSAAALRAGVSYSTMACWAAKMDVFLQRRPKRLDAACWNSAVEMLSKGALKSEVASACDISQVTVTRILRNVPGLQELWHRTRFNRSRACARDAWSAIAGSHPYLGLTALKDLEPSAYAWLYRNDRLWLSDSVRLAPVADKSNYASQRVRNADQRMASALERLALELALDGTDRTLDHIERSLPGIRKAISNPQQWPSTVRMISSVMKSKAPRPPGEDLLG